MPQLFSVFQTSAPLLRPSVARFLHSGYTLFGVPWLLLYGLGVRRGEPAALSERYHMSLAKIAWTSATATLLSFFCAYTWFLSLPRTTVAASNSIFQVMQCLFAAAWACAAIQRLLCRTSRLSRPVCSNRCHLHSPPRRWCTFSPPFSCEKRYGRTVWDEP